MLNKIFVGMKRDGTFEVHRSLYSPRGEKYKTVIQVEIENVFEPEKRTFSCRVEGGFSTDERLWDFIKQWAVSNIIIDPSNITLGPSVYFIKDPDNTIAGPQSVVIATGSGTLIADGSFQITAYGEIMVYKKAGERVDAWENVTVNKLD